MVKIFDNASWPSFFCDEQEFRTRGNEHIKTLATTMKKISS